MYFDLPERPCHDLLALDCDPLDPRIPIACKENSQIELVDEL